MDELINVLVVNHNQPRYTYNVIRDLKKQTINHKLMVVNNGCDSKRKVDSAIARLSTSEVAESNENRDLNKLWNSFARTMSNKYLCFLNNDVRIPDNFLQDTVDVFEKEPEVGLVIHVTNHNKFIKKTELNYKVLEGKNALCQGWDFSIRKELFPYIDANKMRIFGGDDYIFAKLVKEGWKVAFVLSSPIIHYKEKTRDINPDIEEIQKHDQKEFFRIMDKENLSVVNNTTTVKWCGKYCNEELAKVWLNENNI